MKYILLVLSILSVNIFANSLKIAPVSVKNIGYKKQISIGSFHIIQLNDKNIKNYRIRCKKFPDIQLMRKGKYRAKHYISKDRVICMKDVYMPKVKKVKFNFGLLEIEKDGEVIKETTRYIKIRNLDGKIQKIYKDGSNL